MHELRLHARNDAACGTQAEKRQRNEDNAEVFHHIQQVKDADKSSSYSFVELAAIK